MSSPCRAGGHSAISECLVNASGEPAILRQIPNDGGPGPTLRQQSGMTEDAGVAGVVRRAQARLTRVEKAVCQQPILGTKKSSIEVQFQLLLNKGIALKMLHCEINTVLQPRLCILIA